MRTLITAAAAALQCSPVPLAGLVEMALSMPIYLNTAGADLTIGDKLYKGTYADADGALRLLGSSGQGISIDSGGNALIGRTTQASGGKEKALGNMVFQPSASAPSLGTNGDLSFQAVSNTSLKILLRGIDGVTRSVTLTMA